MPPPAHIAYYVLVGHCIRTSTLPHYFSFFSDRPLEPPVALTTGARAPLFRGFFAVTTKTVYSACFLRCLMHALCRKRWATAKTNEMCENYHDVFFFSRFRGRSRAFILFGSWPIEKEMHTESEIIIIRVKENR